MTASSLLPLALLGLVVSTSPFGGCSPRTNVDDDDDFIDDDDDSAADDDDDTGDDDDDSTGDDDDDTNPAWPAGWESFEEEVLVFTNEARASGYDCDTEGVFGPAGPLTMQQELRWSSRYHAEDMALQDYFSHDSLDGRDFGDRIQEAGYTGWFTIGENIAAGSPTPRGVVDGWLDSDGHCANIMNPNFTELGVGYYSGAGSYNHYWVQNFGAR